MIMDRPKDKMLTLCGSSVYTNQLATVTSSFAPRCLPDLEALPGKTNSVVLLDLRSFQSYAPTDRMIWFVSTLPFFSYFSSVTSVVVQIQVDK